MNIDTGILDKINEEGISVIIGARNEYPQIGLTICNLMEDMYATGITKWEIILMDNGSEDETSRFFSWKKEKGSDTAQEASGRGAYMPNLRGLVNEHRLRIFFDPVYSNVGTRNKGVLKARYENIIFSDAHQIVRHGTVYYVIETLIKNQGIVHAPISWMGASCDRPQPGYQYSYKVGEKIWGCVDDQTELLTSEGWKKHYEVSTDSKFVTLNIKSREIEIQKATDITIYDHSGEAYELKGKGYDLLLTPNHRCVVDNGDMLEIKEARDLTERDYLPLTNEGIIKRGKCDKDLIWLLAAIVCDGSLYAKRANEDKDFIRIIAKKERKVKTIKNLLSKKGIKYSLYTRPSGVNVFSIYKDSGGQLLKFVPNKEFTYGFINSLNNSGLKELQEALIFFDGNVYKDDVTFTQARKNTSEMFEYISVLLGNKIYTYEIDPKVKKGNSYQKKKLYKTYVTKNKRRIGIKKVKKHYKGKMWCPTVPNGTIFAKRNGKVVVTANTWNKIKVAEEPFFIPICGHAFLAVRKKQFLRFRGYPYAQRVYGGGEPYLDTKYWMLGSTSMMDPRALVYHLSAGRGYAWHNDDLIHNMFLVSYILGGEKWADRILITYLNKYAGVGDFYRSLYQQAVRDGEEDFKWLEEHKKLTFEEVIGLDKTPLVESLSKEELEKQPWWCTTCTKRGKSDPHVMRVWDTHNQARHGNHRSLVAEFKLRRDEAGKVFIGNTEITTKSALEVAGKYI